MNLLRAELAHILHRRLTKVTAALTVGFIALAGVMTYLTHDGTPPDMAVATALADEQRALCEASYIDDQSLTAEDLALWCHTEPEWFVADDAFHATSLLSDFADTGDWGQARPALLERTTFQTSTGLVGESPATGFSGQLAQLGMMLVVVSAVLGASAVGADWRSGLIESQLIRRPRRLRMMGTKLASVALIACGYALAASALLVGALIPSAVWRGDFDGTRAEFWLDVASLVARTGLAAAAVAAIAAAITMATRHTAAGVITILLAFIGSPVIERLPWGWVASTSPAGNLLAWLERGDVSRLRTYQVPGGAESWEVALHGWGVAGALVVIALMATAALGAITFVRRDVA